MKAFLLYALTALAEIAGCYAFFMTVRGGKTPLWIIPGVGALVLFAWLLTLHPAAGAGRVYAAYGGIYIVASLAWLWLVEKSTPDRWDLLGGTICLLGAAIIYFGPRST